MKLRLILVTLSLMVFLSTVVGGYFYYSSVKDAAVEEARRQAVFHIESIRNHLSYFLGENLDSVTALAGLKELQSALIDRNPQSLAEANAILDHFKHAYRVDVCYLIDRQGTTIASSNRGEPDSFVGNNYAFRPYFKHAMKGDPDPSYAYMALGITSGKRGIYTSYPVHADAGRPPVGVAAIKASIAPMEKEFARPYEGIVMLTDPHGIVFMSNRKDLVLQTLSELTPEATQQIRKERQFGDGPWPWIGLRVMDADHAVDPAGKSYLLHQLEVDHHPGWNLVCLSDVDSILRRVSGSIIRISSLLILTWCGFVGIAVFILYRKASREINQRKMAEEALRDARVELERHVKERTEDLAATVNEFRESEEKYRTLTNNLSVGVFRTTPGPRGRYIEVNPAYLNMFGFDDKETLFAQYANDLYQNPDDRERFSRKMLSDGSVKNEEIMLKRKDGSLFHGSVTAVAVKGADGNVKYYDGILEDITEARRVEEDARARREELAHLGRVATMGELSASLAHQLNQPLTAILSNAQAALNFLAVDSPDLIEIREILEDIVTDDRRAGEVIRRLRNLYKKGELERTPMDINDLVKDVVFLIESETTIRNVSIRLMLGGGLPRVLGDWVHLQQVMINFIFNASEAMADVDDAPREIDISTAVADRRRVTVSIRDFGVGIQKTRFERIVEPFYTTKAAGMGMGLSINRSIIEAHAGRMWAENNPDRGATFYFTLPTWEES